MLAALSLCSISARAHRSCVHTLSTGLVWADVPDVLKNDAEIRETAAVQHPAGVDYVFTAFVAHLAYGQCGDAALRLIAKALELCGGALSSGEAEGLRIDCEGCELAGNIKRNQGLQQDSSWGELQHQGNRCTRMLLVRLCLWALVRLSMCCNPDSVGSHAFRIGCAHMQETVRHTLPGWTVCSDCRVKTQ